MSRGVTRLLHQGDADATSIVSHRTAGKRNTYTFTDPKYSDPENPDAATDPYRPWAHAVSRDAEIGSPTSARSEREHTNQDTTSPARDLESG